MATDGKRTRKGNDFAPATVRALAERAGRRCSMCDRTTSGPSNEGPLAISQIGVAAHISAAAPGGRRYNPLLTPRQRKDIGNGIWLCQSHATHVDRDEITFTVEHLQQLKLEHERKIAAELSATGSRPIAAVLDATVSQAVLTWPTTLLGGRWLARDELESIDARLKDSECYEPLVVLGVPGSGKSALLARLALRLQEQQVDVVGLRVDGLPKAVASQQDLSRWVGLPEGASFVDVLRGKAAKGRTVLIVDQLDGLSDLVDLETERLTVVLNLIEQLRGTANLQIVASCRTFDFTHDVRFRRFHPEPIELTLPPWKTIEESMIEAGLDPKGLPSSMRDVLRVPQHLKIYAELREKGVRDQESYLSMLEDLWGLHVKGHPDRLKLVDNVAHAMARDEVLFAPIALADDVPYALDALRAAGILRVDGLRIGFTHQSLFDFARGRAFAHGGEQLADHVRARQTGLFVRPLLWSALAYLRDTSSPEYKKQFGALFDDPSLRLHLRVLLAEFLGQLTAPDEDEVRWFVGALSDDQSRRASLRSMTAGPGWFDALEPVVLPRMLRAPYSRELTPLLSNAARLAPVRTVELLKENWRHAPEQSLSVLASLTDWGEDAIRLVEELLADASLVDGIVTRVIGAILDAKPVLAPRAIAASLRGKVDAALHQRQTQDFTRGWLADQQIASALECGRHVIDLADLAHDQPGPYLTHLFPVLIRTAGPISHVPHDTNCYADSGIFEGSDDGATAFAEAIERAAISLASDDPDAFVDFARSAQASSLMVVHRILARAYAALPPGRRRSEAMGYILGDARRLSISAAGEREAATCELIGDISAELDASDVESIESAIFASQLYERGQESAELRGWWAREDLQHRAQVLGSLPLHLLSQRGRSLAAPEKPARRRQRALRRQSRASFIGSPVSAAQMGRATDEHILGLFDQLPDETEWRHPTRQLEGGSIEASRQFGEFAKAHAHRAERIIRRLKPAVQEVPAAHGLSSLGEVTTDAAAWEALVIDTINRGFGKEEFRWHLANAISRHAEQHKGASDAICHVLEQWLSLEPLPPSSLADEYGPVSERFPESAGAEAPLRKQRSILFERDGLGGPLPRGNYPSLHALFSALLHREPAEPDRWLCILEKHLTRREQTSVWSWICLDLRYLGMCSDHLRAQTLLIDLYATYPALLESARGIHLFAYSIPWLNAAGLTQLLQSLESNPTPFAQQALGELAVLIECRRPEFETWIATSLSINVHRSEGIALAASSLWAQEKFRPRATKLLVDAMGHDDPRVRGAALQVFNHIDRLSLDESASALLERVVRDPLLVATMPDDVLSVLHLLIPLETEKVATLVEMFLDAVDAGHRGQEWIHTAGPELLSLSLTLQRLGNFRIRGMAIFERLLGHGAYGIDELLFDLDARPRALAPAPMRRRPRRKPARAT